MGEWDWLGQVGWAVFASVLVCVLLGVIKTSTQKKRERSALKGLIVSELFSHESSLYVRGDVNKGLNVSELDVRLAAIGSPHRRLDIERALKELKAEGKVTDTFVADISRHSWALKWTEV